MTGTRRRQTVKNGAIIPNRKVEKKNHVIKQQKYDSVCVCVERIDRVKKSKFTMGGSSGLSLIESESVQREMQKSVRERDRESERARAFVMTSISLWGIPGFMLMRSS